MPINVNPNQIIRYMECPRACALEWKELSEKKVQQKGNGGGICYRIVQRTIRWIYLEMARTGKVPSWRRIAGKVDRSYSELIVADQIDPRTLFTESQSMLGALHHWYSNFFQEYKYSGLANIPMSLFIDDAVIFSDEAELVLLGEDVTLLDISEGETTATAVFNDPVVQIRLWAWWRWTDDLPARFIRLGVKPESVLPYKINVLRDTVKRTEAVVRQVMRGMKDNVWYPSYGTHCSTCRWIDRCEW